MSERQHDPHHDFTPEEYSAGNGGGQYRQRVSDQAPPLGFPSDGELTRMANALFNESETFPHSPFEDPPAAPGAHSANYPSSWDPSSDPQGWQPSHPSPAQPYQPSPVQSHQPPAVHGYQPSAVQGYHPTPAPQSPFPSYGNALAPVNTVQRAVPLNETAFSPVPLATGGFSGAPSSAPQHPNNPHAGLPPSYGGVSTPQSAPAYPHTGNPFTPPAIADGQRTERGYSPALYPEIPARPTAAASIGNIGFDPHIVRRDFPILAEIVNGQPLTWLDNAATTHKPNAVIDRLSEFYRHENSNIHRAAHELARRATDAYEAAREGVAQFLRAMSEEIIFVRGTTEAINLLAQTFGRSRVGEGDEVIVTHLEHHANIVPWQLLCSQRKAKLLVAPVDDTGQIQLEEFQSLFSPRTRLVSMSQVSNALGTVTPAKQMIDIAHRMGVPVILDGAQSVSHMAVDVKALDCDFFVFSGHKIFGPTGIGAVYGKRELLEQMPPWQGGGNMIKDVTFERTVYHPAPMRFEAGTGNIADAVGLHAALQYVQRLGLESIGKYEHSLLEYGTQKLEKIPGLRMIGTADDKAGVLSFVVAGVDTFQLGQSLSQAGIAVRAGHHCAQPILRRFGVEATVRASLAFYNVPEELDRLAEVVQQSARNLYRK